MTDKTKEALKLALDVLTPDPEEAFWWVEKKKEKAITAIREALADIGNPITEQLAIPTVITCPFCSSEHVPGWLHDLNMDRGAYGKQPAQQQGPKKDLMYSTVAMQERHAAFVDRAVATLEQAKREALAEQPAQQQEPVAWIDEYDNAFPLAAKQYSVVGKHWKPLYTLPPAQLKPWVGLTNNELQLLCDEYRILFGSWVTDFAYTIETKLREKNNG